MSRKFVETTAYLPRTTELNGVWEPEDVAYEISAMATWSNGKVREIEILDIYIAATNESEPVESLTMEDLATIEKAVKHELENRDESSFNREAEAAMERADRWVKAWKNGDYE